MKPLIKKAMKFAKEKHKGQLDDNGLDYFQAHLINVYNIAKQVRPNDENFLCASLLHDTIEDCGVKQRELRREFNLDVLNLVMEITHEQSDKGNYFPRLKTERGIILKYCDRLSNLSRMQSWDKDRREHYLRRSKFWKASEEDSIIFGQPKRVD